MSSSPRKAAVLLSGGLDSLLAAHLVKAQGVHVEGLNFYTGFCVEGHTQAIRGQGKKKPKRNNALWAAQQLDIPLHIIDVVEPYKDVVLNPKHGYGANMNPCLDCKVFMVKRAWQWCEENGFDFIVTGEVVGQRPMSQRRDTMPLVQRESGVMDRLVRPLCAQKLPPSLPERMGWVDRAGFKDFSGRSRKPQMALAESAGFTDYAQPAGGCCFLTDPNYTKKLVDLWEAKSNREYELDDIVLLKVGRHFRIAPHVKVIIGREEGENNYLEGYRKTHTHIRTISHTGPLSLLDGTPSEEDIKTAAALAARYTKANETEPVTVSVTQGDETKELTVMPMTPSSIPEGWLL